MDDNTILKVKDLSINFETKHGVVRAVDEISFDIEKGQVVRSGRRIGMRQIHNGIGHNEIASGTGKDRRRKYNI